MSPDDFRLIVAFLMAVVTLVILITRYSLSPFIALLFASIVLALAARLELASALEEFAIGVGGILGSTAILIGLGAMIGILLDRSGARR